jgi:hypothetical protein
MRKFIGFVIQLLRDFNFQMFAVVCQDIHQLLKLFLTMAILCSLDQPQLFFIILCLF